MTTSIQDFHMPRYHEIPDVGLYLDQTVKYINRAVSSMGYGEITSSMVSNYVKKGYISNPIKKQYSPEQIARLLFMTVVKNSISMENIGRLFTLQRNRYTPDVAYDYFCDELENMLLLTFGYKETSDTIGDTSTLEKQMLRSLIIAVANTIYLSDCFDHISWTEGPGGILTPGADEAH